MTAPTILEMGWRDVLFAHFRVDAARVAATLPPGIELDTFDGQAWASVVPFRLENVRLRFAPVLPGFASVPELNLRTYVRVGARRGIYFYNLDAGSVAASVAARALTGLPYFPARMSVSEDASGIAFRSVRRGSGAARFRARYRPAGVPSTPVHGTLDRFLHDRFAFFTPRRGRIVVGEIAHGPWRITGAELDIFENTLGEPIGDAFTREPDRVTFSRGVDVRASGVAAMPREAPGHGA